MLEISDFERRGICTINVAKTKALMSFAVTAKLICVFIFAYAQRVFSHDAAKKYAYSAGAQSDLVLNC